MSHNYAEGISFYYIPKKDFDTLLDQVKIICKEDYQVEAKDGFRSLYEYWNERGQKRINQKIENNKEQIKFLS
jgi:lipoprotein NlpI